MVKKATIVMVVFALLGSPFGALFLWLHALLWAVFDQTSDILNILGAAPVVLFMALFSYFVGFIPALLAGLLFAVWYVRQMGSPPLWKMVLFGSMCGGVVFLMLQQSVFVMQSKDCAAQSGFVMQSMYGLYCSIRWLYVVFCLYRCWCFVCLDG